jgi:hypothetical protein
MSTFKDGFTKYLSSFRGGYMLGVTTTTMIGVIFGFKIMRDPMFYIKHIHPIIIYIKER